MSKFKGVDSRFEHKSADGSAEIVNFRILPDGSLQKRAGYRALAKFESAVRAMWTGRIDGRYVGYVLVNNTVSRIDLDTGELTSVGTINTYDTKAEFFYYQAVLYLVDGYRIYAITESGVSFPRGYIPLVGKDWSDTYRGAPYEPRNLLNNKGRITYVISDDPSNYLKTDESIVSIDLVLINGVIIDSSRYNITAMNRTVSVSGMQPGDRVEMFFTYADFPYTDAYSGLMSNNCATIFGGINNFRPFLWGGRKGVMYTAAYVSEDSLASSKVGDSKSDALYFPANYEFTVGDGASDITAVSRHYDRLLIFTENGAWMADSSACGVDDFPVLNINSNVGVLSQGAAAMIGNRPCTVGQSSIYRWTSSTEEFDECNAYSISAPIDGLLPADFYRTASVFSDVERGEIYFCAPCIMGRAWVYSDSNDCWVCFEDVPAEKFVSCGNRVGFFSANTLFVFDDDLTVDIPEPYVASYITARYRSNLIDFGRDGNKRLTELTFRGDNGYFNACVFFDEEDGYVTDKMIDLRSPHKVIHRRLNTPRFGSIRLEIYCDCNERLMLHSLTLEAKLKHRSS